MKWAAICFVRVRSSGDDPCCPTAADALGRCREQLSGARAARTAQSCRGFLIPSWFSAFTYPGAWNSRGTDGFRDDGVRWRCCRDRSTLRSMDRVPATRGKCAQSPQRVSEKNRERGNRQLLHSMWLLKFGQPRQPQRCSHPCRNPRKLDSCACLSIFRTRLTDAEPGRQFPRIPLQETLFRNAGSHSQWRRYERGRLLARAAWFQATWVCN